MILSDPTMGGAIAKPAFLDKEAHVEAFEVVRGVVRLLLDAGGDLRVGPSLSPEEVPVDTMGALLVSA